MSPLVLLRKMHTTSTRNFPSSAMSLALRSYRFTGRETYLVGSVALLNQRSVCHGCEMESVYHGQEITEEVFTAMDSIDS